MVISQKRSERSVPSHRFFLWAKKKVFTSWTKRFVENAKKTSLPDFDCSAADHEELFATEDRGVASLLKTFAFVLLYTFSIWLNRGPIFNLPGEGLNVIFCWLIEKLVLLRTILYVTVNYSLFIYLVNLNLN